MALSRQLKALGRMGAVLAVVGGVPASASASAAGPGPDMPAAPPTCPVEGRDADGDGLTDACEFGLLERFAPALVASPQACNWDADAGRLRGGYLVGARPIRGGVRLAYLPAYLEDCGWSGAKCLLRPRGGCGPHAGDSEAIFIDVAGDVGTDAWEPERVFLSAHCFGRSGGRCRWFDARELQWVGNAAVVWVAEGKNANYASQDLCDSGHWHFDTCDRNDRAFRFPVTSLLQDIGSARHPFPHGTDDASCADARSLAFPPDIEGTECIWTSARFGGWSGSRGEGATGYRRYLEEVGGFIPAAPGP